MLVLAFCEDSCTASQLRPKWLAPHARHLADLGNMLRFSAPFAPGDGATLTTGLEGSIIIVEGGDLAVLTSALTSDPYASSGVWRRIDFYEAKQVARIEEHSLLDRSEGKRWYASFGSDAPLSAAAAFRTRHMKAWLNPGSTAAGKDALEGERFSLVALFASNNMDTACEQLTGGGETSPSLQGTVKAIPAAIGSWAKPNSA